MPKASRTGGQHNFALVPRAEIERSVLDRSCGLKTAFNAGVLIPIFLDEALPGDTVNLKLQSFGRLSTLLHPIMENIYIDYHFFSVPYRLVWDNFQKFMGEQKNPTDSTDFVVPTVTAGTFAEQSLGDYLGLPVGVAVLANTISALPFRAYMAIYNEWYRDENLVNSVVFFTNDGPDNAQGAYALQKRGKRHDYFTSCLPFAQKGTSVTVPLGSTAPVMGTGGQPTFQNAASNPTARGARLEYATTPAPHAVHLADPTGWTTAQDLYWDQPNLMVNLDEATSSTINKLREAFQIQRMFERDARGGSRYTETILSHFGVRSDDARQQRPEYLGGGTSRFNINPVASTNNNADPSINSIGNLGAFGTTSANGIGFVKSFTEHCFIMGIASVRADLNYQQGLERMWSRRTRFDFYWPALAHLGEQAVFNKEIYFQGTAADEDVFGYQERFAEYRYKPSRVTGRMRSSSTASLDTWHLAQDFSALPALNQAFIEEAPPIDRVLAVTAALEPQFLLDCWFQYRHARPMPVYGVPGLIDHF